MRLPLLRDLMLWGMKLTVPRQRIGVSMIALDEAERVFLLKHVFHPSVPWGPPAGWLGRNEAPVSFYRAGYSIGRTVTPSKEWASGRMLINQRLTLVEEKEV